MRLGQGHTDSKHSGCNSNAQGLVESPRSDSPRGIVLQSPACRWRLINACPLWNLPTQVYKGGILRPAEEQGRRRWHS